MLHRMADLVGGMADGVFHRMRLVADRMADLMGRMADVVTGLGGRMGNRPADGMLQEVEGVLEGTRVDRDVEVEVDAETGRQIAAETEIDMVMREASMRLAADTDLARVDTAGPAARPDAVNRRAAAGMSFRTGARHRDSWRRCQPERSLRPPSGLESDRRRS